MYKSGLRFTLRPAPSVYPVCTSSVHRRAASNALHLPVSANAVERETRKVKTTQTKDKTAQGYISNQIAAADLGIANIGSAEGFPHVNVPLPRFALQRDYDDADDADADAEMM